MATERWVHNLDNVTFDGRMVVRFAEEPTRNPVDTEVAESVLKVCTRLAHKISVAVEKATLGQKDERNLFIQLEIAEHPYPKLFAEWNQTNAHTVDLMVKDNLAVVEVFHNSFNWFLKQMDKRKIGVIIDVVVVF